MKRLSAHLLRKWSFYSITILSTITLVSYQNCGKVKFNAQRNQVTVQQSCGSISMAPQNGLAESTSIAFTVTSPNGITISGLTWSFTKGTSATAVYSSTTNPAIHTFNGPNEGVGDYLATAIFMKSDGNACELAQSFQIITGDLCVDPSGINGPTVGFVGEETSPFSVDYEDCFVGTVVWDMDTNGIPEHNSGVRDTVTHTYTTPGSYTVTATVIDGEDNSQTVLTSTIVINYANCTNGATNPPACDACPTGQSLVGGQCVVTPCANGATNPPTCTTCPAGRIMVGGQCIIPTDCNVNGTAMAHGETRNFYPTSSVSCGGACTPESRTCNNGAVSGNAGSTSATCSVAFCNACTLDGVTVPHGQSHTFFNSSSVACGQICSSTVRNCNNGVYSGNNTYDRAACSAAPCAQTGCWTCTGNESECTPGPAAGCGYSGYLSVHGGPDLRGTACPTQGASRTFQRMIPATVTCDVGWLSCESCGAPGGGGGGGGF